jgi:hypothetical protein
MEVTWNEGRSHCWYLLLALLQLLLVLMFHCNHKEYISSWMSRLSKLLIVEVMAVTMFWHPMVSIWIQRLSQPEQHRMITDCGERRTTISLQIETDWVSLHPLNPFGRWKLSDHWTGGQPDCLFFPEDIRYPQFEHPMYPLTTIIAGLAAKSNI